MQLLTSTAFLVVALVTVLPAPCACKLTVRGLGSRTEGQHGGTALRPAGEGVVRPFRFDQRLIVCNAYPSQSPMTVKKNGQEMIAAESQPLQFNECRYIKSRVQPHDKLDVVLRDMEIHGTFEVGALPASDAVLLLVLEKRATSPLVNFQSFAFPATTDKKDAQLAVIDAFRSNSSLGHLKMEDHTTGKEEKTVSKRVEQLNFNRVYSIEEGTYDASVAGQSDKKLLNLAKNQNYVVIRTGEEGHFPESLVLFPELPSSSWPCARAWLALALAAAAMLAV